MSIQKLAPIELKYMGKPANQFYFQTSMGIIGPFSASPLPLPEGIYAQRTRVAVPISRRSPCAMGQWAQSESHLYVCGASAAVSGQSQWRRLAFDQADW
jgi:hypothetical protein